jgi:hypothetical protein
MSHNNTIYPGKCGRDFRHGVHPSSAEDMDHIFSPLQRKITESTVDTSSGELRQHDTTKTPVTSHTQHSTAQPIYATFLSPHGTILQSTQVLVSQLQSHKNDMHDLCNGFDSTLSLQDLYVTSEDAVNHQKDYSAEEEDTDDEDGRGGINYDNTEGDATSSNKGGAAFTPPTSLSGNPTHLFSKGTANMEILQPPLAVASATNAGASSNVGSIQSISTVGSNPGGSASNQKPMLYSAIGSLEDPSNASYKGWKTKAGAASKFEFPSTMTHVPPKGKTKAKKNNGRSSMQLQTGTAQCSKDSHSKESSAVNKPSNLRRGKISQGNSQSNADISHPKKVTIVNDNAQKNKAKLKKTKRPKGPVEMFRPSSDAYTPRMGKKEIKYKPAEMRSAVQQMASPMGSLSRPDFRDALRRVAMILHQHIVKIEHRFEKPIERRANKDEGLFSNTMKDLFSEDKFVTPKYKCSMVRVPMARGGMVCGLKRIREKYEIPTENEIYEFAHCLFKSVQLSSECSIVCLIYIERLMEISRVPLLAITWRPIFMCGLLLASKVWQDLSSWNIEFASVYPQYSLDAINRLELQFVRLVKWDLYISSSQYAKYYFALRSLVEKPDFRQRYNRMVGGVDSVEASQARKIEERTTMIKEEALLQLSRSM